MRRIALILSLSSGALLSVCSVWLLVLESGDWDGLLPIRIALLIAPPLAVAGLICALVVRGRGSNGDTLVRWLIAIDLLVIGVPWTTLWLAS